MTGDQKHTDHISNGQQVSRHSSRPDVFYFFPYRTFLKTILANRTNGTFALALAHKADPSAKAKEPNRQPHRMTFVQRNSIFLRILGSYNLIIL